MIACPRCGGTSFADAVCLQCGTPYVVLGEEVGAPPTYVTKGGLVLTEIVEDEGEVTGGREDRIEGFEATRLEETPIRKSKAPPASPPKTPPKIFASTLCPSCGVDLPQPPPLFCDHCGNRLPRAKKLDPAAAGEKKRCKECGFRNDPARAVCINCGQRI